MLYVYQNCQNSYTCNIYVSYYKMDEYQPWSTVWRLRLGPEEAMAGWWTLPLTAQTPDPSDDSHGHRRAVELSLHAPRVQLEVGILGRMLQGSASQKVQRQDRQEQMFW